MTLHIVVPGQQWAIENGVETKTKPVVGYPNKKACQYAKADISDILLKKHATDAHFTSYAVLDGIGAYRYNYPIFSDQKFQLIREAGGGIEMSLVVFESDSPAKKSVEPGALDEWWELEKTKVDAVLANHPGGLAWRTKGGYRIAWRCPPGRLLQSVDDAVLWRKNYLSAVCHFQRVYDIHFDPACGEWNRLQRVPMGTRLGEEGPVVREVLGGALVGAFDTRSVPSADDVKQSKLIHAAAWKEPRLKGNAQPASPCDEYNAPTIGVPSVWERILSKRSMLGRSLGPTKHVARCPNAAKHTTSGETSTVLYAAEPGSIYGRPYCSHGHCVGLDWRVELGVGDDEWHTYVRDVKDESGIIIVPLVEEADIVPAGTVWSDGDTDELVIGKLICKDNNPTQPAGISHNVSLLLTGMKQWRGRLVYDNFKHNFYWKDVPKELEREHAYDKKVLPADYSYIQAWLLQGGGSWHGARPKVNATIEAVKAGVHAACSVNTVDSLIEHVNQWRGKWDGVPRLDTWLPKYMGAADTPLNRAIGARWLIASLARALRPGCLADMMPILEGRQGIGKGRVLDILFGHEWIVIPYGLKLGCRDFEQMCSDAWIVHDDELASLLKAGLEPAKSWLTKRTAKYRMAYAEQFIDVPRRFMVVGSTNPKKYLEDEENRRFQPVVVSRLDFDGLASVLTPLWAEAHLALERGDTYFIRPDDEVWAALQDVHATKKVEDVLIGTIHRYIDEGRLPLPCRVADVMGVMGYPPHQLGDKREVMKVSEAMRRMGLVKRQERRGGAKGYWYDWPTD